MVDFEVTAVEVGRRQGCGGAGSWGEQRPVGAISDRACSEDNRFERICRIIISWSGSAQRKPDIDPFPFPYGDEDTI